MGHKEVDKIVGDMQQAPAGADDSHNFSQVYQDLSSLKSSESAAQYQQDMAELNQKMHDQGILPNCTLVDIDSQNPQGLQFTDQNGATLTRDASHVYNDLGALNKAGLDMDDPNQVADFMLAQVMGANISRNPDGSFDVDMDPEKMLSMFNKVGGLFDGMVGGLAGSDSPQQPATGEPAQEETETA